MPDISEQRQVKKKKKKKKNKTQENVKMFVAQSQIRIPKSTTHSNKDMSKKQLADNFF